MVFYERSHYLVPYCTHVTLWQLWNSSQ